MPISPTYLHKRCHSILLAGQLAGPRGGGLGRPAVVPPAGKGRGLDARPCQGAGGERVGRFLRKRRGMCGPRGLDPYV